MTIRDLYKSHWDLKHTCSKFGRSFLQWACLWTLAEVCGRRCMGAPVSVALIICLHLLAVDVQAVDVAFISVSQKAALREQMSALQKRVADAAKAAAAANKVRAHTYCTNSEHASCAHTRIHRHLSRRPQTHTHTQHAGLTERACMCAHARAHTHTARILDGARMSSKRLHTYTQDTPGQHAHCCARPPACVRLQAFTHLLF